MRQRFTVPQSLILHKIRGYFVKVAINITINKQALLHFRVLFAWAMKFRPNRKYVGPIYTTPNNRESASCRVFLRGGGRGRPRARQTRFYRAMHFSANARYWDCMSSVRLSVCLSVSPSVTLVICDYIGWKSWKLISRTISPTPSLLAAKRRSTYSQGNMGKFWGN